MMSIIMYNRGERKLTKILSHFLEIVSSDIERKI